MSLIMYLTKIQFEPGAVGAPDYAQLFREAMQ
jgi:hypothetical protein